MRGGSALLRGLLELVEAIGAMNEEPVLSPIEVDFQRFIGGTR